MNKAFSMLLGLVIIVGVAALVFIQSQRSGQLQVPGYGKMTGESAEQGPDIDDDGDEASPELSDVSAASSSKVTQKVITMAEVQKHTDAKSCWSVIDGIVYDLTSWIPRHPGGEKAILGLCGKDGTQAFRDQHDHAARQENILATMKIGELSK